MAHLRPQRLLSVGSIVADVRIDVPHLPERGGDVLGLSAVVSAGGGFNILAAAARNGMPACFAGRHGTGPYGARIRMDLASEGIAALLAPDPDADSGFCVVLVEPDGERSFITSPGVEAQLGERSLAGIGIASGDAIFVSGYDLCYPELGAAIASFVACLPPDVLLAIDPGPLVGEIPQQILQTMLLSAGIWTMNRREAEIFAGTPDIEQAVDLVLPRLSPDALLVLRDGAAGCLIAGQRVAGSPQRIPAPAVRMIDSTGAGDAHTGVLLAGLSGGLDPVSAARRANAAAAISVTRPGPAMAPTSKELDAFLAASQHDHVPQPGRPQQRGPER